MPVPKWLLAAIGVIAGFFVLAVLRATMADDQPATEVGPAAIASREPVAPSGESAAQPVNITIVVAQPPVDPAAPAGPAASTTYAVPAAPHAYAGRAPVQAARPRQTPTSFARASAPTPTRGPGAVAYTAAPTRSVNPTPFVVSYLPGAPGPTPAGANAPARPTASGPVDIHDLDGFSIIANGNNIVIANNGSIVSVGDNTVLTANTGDAGASSIIALDVAGSAVTSGSSTASGWTNGSSQPPPGSPTNAPGSPSTAATASAPDGGAPGTRAVAIAGYQDRTLEVVGDDNLLTSNDSNLFFNRAGHLNANTGDTDMSALNVVDATGSLVRSGNSSAPAGPAPVGQASTASATAVAGAAPPGAATAVVGPDGTATATGADALAIGGPGVVDASVDMYGDRNVTTIDDGNVTVGGAGDVNAQIGDSDTSGAVVMDVTDSAITTGNSGPAAAVLTPSDITTSDQP